MISNSLRFAELGLVYIENYLTSSDWWIEVRGARQTSSELQFEYLAYVECTKFGLFHIVFSGVEASFRAFLRAIDPSAAQDGRAQFEGVFVCLLKTHLKLLQRDLDLIDLLSAQNSAST